MDTFERLLFFLVVLSFVPGTSFVSGDISRQYVAFMTILNTKAADNSCNSDVTLIASIICWSSLVASILAILGFLSACCYPTVPRPVGMVVAVFLALFFMFELL